MGENFSKELSSNGTGTRIHQHIKKETGCYDPYFHQKKEGNEIALSLIPKVREILEKDSSLETYVKIAIVGNILDFGLGALLHGGPGLGPQFIDARRFAFLGTETTDFVEGMDRNKDHIAAGIHQFDDFMDPPFVVGHLHQAAEDADAMVDVDNVIAHMEGGKVVEGQLLGFFDAAAEADPVEAVENLMVRIMADLSVMVNESLMKVLSLDKFR